MFSTLGDTIEYTGGLQYTRGYHEYTGECSVSWGFHTNSIVFPMTFPHIYHDIPRVLMICPWCTEHPPLYCTLPGVLHRHPGDFVTEVKQINSQSDLTWMKSFGDQSYLTIRSSVYIILILDPCIFNLYNLCQTGSN